MNNRELLQDIFNTYIENVNKFYFKNNASAAVRARLALSRMVPIIKELRKDIQKDKIKLINSRANNIQ